VLARTPLKADGKWPVGPDLLRPVVALPAPRWTCWRVGWGDQASVDRQTLDRPKNTDGDYAEIETQPLPTEPESARAFPRTGGQTVSTQS
jgi:hypothetical protein